jgi:hypothetical protein
LRRHTIISYYDWAQDPGVAISVGAGSFASDRPASNMLTIQGAAQATGTSITFTVDLGATRLLGLIHLQNLVTDPSGTIRIQAGSYDSGTVSSWPVGAAGLYSSLLYAALGRPRIFIPPAPVLASSVTVTIDAVVSPLQIGYFGACEIWEQPNGMPLSSHLTTFDESDVQRVPFGSSYRRLRGKRRRLSFGSNPIPDQANSAAPSDYSRALEAALINGKSIPVIGVPYPDDIENIERDAVWGLISTDAQFENMLFGLYQTTWQIDQLIIGRGRALVGSSFSVGAVHFEENATHYEQSGTPSLAGATECSLSVWLNPVDAGGVLALVDGEPASNVKIGLFTASMTGLHPGVDIFDATATNEIDVFANDPLAAGSWQHVLISWRTSDATVIIAVNDVVQATTINSANTGFVPDWSSGPLNLYGETAEYVGDTAEFWLSSTFIDFTVSANRRKFISATGTPVDLGANGETPLGTPPEFYLHITAAETDPANFAVNHGSGGALNIITDPGPAPTIASSHP